MRLILADKSHFEIIKKMALKFKEASPYKDLPLHDDKVERLVNELIKAPLSKSTVILAEKEGEIVGLLAGSVSEQLFNNDKIASEIMWWVEPEHRRSRISLELLNAFEYWAKAVGCTVASMVMIETEQAEAVHKLYTKRGYRTTEKAYIKDIV